MEKLLQKEAPEESGAVRNENQRSSRMRRDFFYPCNFCRKLFDCSENSKVVMEEFRIESL